MTDCPCKDCPNRHPACHASCPNYGLWKKTHDKQREERNAARQTQAGLWNQQRDVYERTRRHNHDRKKA